MSAASEVRTSIAKAVFTPIQGEDESGTHTTFLGPHIGRAFVTPRLFGGQAVSQCHRAFQQQSAGRCVHSMHYNFNAPGHVSDPIEYRLHSGVGEGEDMGIGKMTAHQNGRVIGSGHCRYSSVCDLSPAPSLELDYVQDPLHYPSTDEILQELGDDAFKKIRNNENLFEQREAEFPEHQITDTPRAMSWSRIRPHLRAGLGEVSGLDVVLLLSDLYIIHVAMHITKERGFSLGSVASLHHNVYIHKQNVNPWGWFLFRREVEAMSWNRAKIHAWIYDENRQCVLSIIQEAYVEARKKKEEKAKL